MIRDGLYEVFEPAPDARYILSKVFKRAFMRVQTQKQIGHHKSHSGSHTYGGAGAGSSNHLMTPGMYSSHGKRK